MLMHSELFFYNSLFGMSSGSALKYLSQVNKVTLAIQYCYFTLATCRIKWTCDNCIKSHFVASEQNASQLSAFRNMKDKQLAGVLDPRCNARVAVGLGSTRVLVMGALGAARDISSILKAKSKLDQFK